MEKNNFNIQKTKQQQCEWNFNNIFVTCEFYAVTFAVFYLFIFLFNVNVYIS